MIESNDCARIQELFRRENRSFLQYVRQAMPWADRAGKTLLENLNQIADEELAALAQFAEWMERSGIPQPYLGAFPTRFSSFNFVDVRTLCRPLVVEQDREVASLLADEHSLATAEAKTEVGRLLELNRKHLALMREFQTR